MEYKTLSKENLFADIREEAWKVFGSIAAFGRFVGRRGNYLTPRCAAAPPGDKRAIGWLLLLLWVDKLGYRIEYRLVKKETKK